jgi:hypothetical protein
MHGIREYVEAGGLMSWTNIAVPLNRTQLRCSLCNLAPSPRGRAAPDPFFLSQRDQLATLAVQHGVPASYNLREFAKAAGLMSYGTSVTEASRQAGLFARPGSAHENACGIVPRPSLQPLHQALQQPGARLDRREEHVFMIRVCAGAVDAESIERWDPHRDREIAVRSAADERRPL